MATTIQKITITYDVNQDRLQLACEDNGGVVTALWLTRRLADRLVRALVAHLEGQVAEPRMQEAKVVEERYNGPINQRSMT